MSFSQQDQPREPLPNDYTYTPCCHAHCATETTDSPTQKCALIATNVIISSSHKKLLAQETTRDKTEKKGWRSSNINIQETNSR